MGCGEGEVGRARGGKGGGDKRKVRVIDRLLFARKRSGACSAAGSGQLGSGYRRRWRCGLATIILPSTNAMTD